MVEKQMTAHRVDRGICGWFWDYVLAHAAGDASKVDVRLFLRAVAFGFSSFDLL